MRDRLGVIRETVTSDFIEAEIGVDTNMLFTDFVKAMVIAYGSGSAAGNERIHKGPPGRMVWDDNLDGKHPSTAAYTTDYMPDEFNQTGNKFVDNAVSLMKRHYDNVLKDALASLPDSVFYGNVIVS